MIDFNPNVNSVLPNIQSTVPQIGAPGGAKDGFSQAVKALDKCVSQVDDLQQSADASIEDLLTGKNNDITAVVSNVAKADVSFKVLVGVRNKLIEAYKQTMNMPL
ncbi:MAG TPA: flagellar hook-basal body complex protein FliE [Sedimentisphaerales bacterium]|nr:flagellar hook-basal body complex protein FliE [Sedimentisphaerales bacterium]HRS10900.1 flagellar hook-basal body complex protein FliE [Sedimentisphaerales bacterium]HRV47605.1 flagellar hook-basal body complex protein FliE [Sedimentisphaerales bacterium]